MNVGIRMCRHPIGCGQAVSGNLPLLLASGDALGRVVVWDVGIGEPVTVLGDAGAACGLKEKVGVAGLSWVTAGHIVAVLLDHGHLVIWDCKSACDRRCTITLSCVS